MSTFKTLAKAHTLESVSTDIAATKEDIEGTLWMIRRHLQRILRHVEHWQEEADDVDWRTYAVEQLQADLQKLTALRDGLEHVSTVHPYCPGCNNTGGFQNNQQAHTCGDSSSDEEDQSSAM